MNPNAAEHVVVTKHDPEGRILEFVKTPIGLPEAEYLKAKAHIETERKREKVLLSESISLIEKSMALRDHAAKNPKPKLPPPAAPVRPALAPPVAAVGRRSPPPRLAPPSAATPKVLDAKTARYQAALLTAWAEKDGGELGKNLIAQTLEPHKDCPAGSRAEVNRDQLNELVTRVLDQLAQQNYPPAKAPEPRAAYVKAFWASADAAVADFNEARAGG